MARDKVYRPRCSVCQYMKKNRDFRFRIMKSTYFNPDGHESVITINRAFGSPFKEITLYAHLKRHQAADKIKAPKPVAIALPELGVIEGEVLSRSEHEQGLDDFIREGRDKLARGELQITANTFLTAIRTKADIEKSTKDRRLEAAKAFFSNAKPELGPGESQN